MRWIHFSPYPLITALLILALAGFRLRKRGLLYLAGMALFGLYLMAVIDAMFFSIPLAENWPSNLSWAETARYLTHQANLIPFYFGSRYIQTSLGMIPVGFPFRDVVGNILLTVPFGMGVQFLAAPRGKKALWLALGAGLALEGIQLLLRVVLGTTMHVIDINDVLMNTLGIFIGYGLYAGAGWGVDRARHFLAGRFSRAARE